MNGLKVENEKYMRKHQSEITAEINLSSFNHTAIKNVCLNLQTRKIIVSFCTVTYHIIIAIFTLLVFHANTIFYFLTSIICGDVFTIKSLLIN